MEERQALSVTQVNLYIKEVIARDDILCDVLVKGELSNFKAHTSGHMYMSLKDEGGIMRAVMFRSSASKLTFKPQNGMKVIARGRISVYERDGQYQLYCSELIDDGRGALDQAFEKLRLRLEQEGLFDPAAKQPLPKYPKKIALVTSPAGAAVRDMIRILGARWPMAEVLVAPVRVQGEGAAEEIAAEMGYSAEYLSARFSKSVGQSFSAYLQQIRLEQACLLLETTDLSVADIARSVGINDIKYFHSVFKSYMNVTPGGFRKLYK